MAQEQIQEQRLTQQQRLAQAVSQQQMLQSQLTELPVTQLLERVNAEMDDNPALEVSTNEGPDEQVFADTADSMDTTDGDSYEQEQRQSALDDALAAIGRDDEELPVYQGGMSSHEDREEMVYGESQSFYDQLKEQMDMVSLNDHEHDIMEYLIGSLDNDGLLRKSLDAISDELAVYHNIDASVSELEQVLHKLQDFDPAGIGARTLQECLILQIARRSPSRLTDLMQQTIENYFELFTRKHWEKLQKQLRLNDLQMNVLLSELRRLNPKPGASMGEAVGRSMHQITPDFIVDTQDDGTVTFSLNMGDVPELTVSPSFTETMNAYQNTKDTNSRQVQEALVYAKNKVDAAQGFIEAMRMRRHTLTITMKAIIQWQHRFFEDGDETSLRPLRLKDIADKTGLDISTVSRVSKSKYVQTRWGVFPLRYFFNDSYTTEDGEEMTTREIKSALREVIDAEDKQKPLSDDALKEALAAKGYPIARRTVSKYREQLGIPIARLRK